MRLHFLGGTDEIGASAILVETGGRRLLVDCGVRQGAKSHDPLPHLALAQGAGGVDAILVTHAHFDHTGALPVVHAAYPGAPVWMTEPTLHLVRLLLLDSLKIMGEKAQGEGDVPLYPQEAVDSLVAASRGCRFLEPEEPLPGIAITFFPAGHILGAAAIGIESSDGRVLLSGDIAVADQITVPGMIAPRFAADALVVESTYGDRLHASREAEERRLAESVGQVIEGGGKVLIPAFAIGRAQEVVLILRRAMRKKTLAPFPIVVDGMVRAVCDIYAGHPDWLSPYLRRRIEKVGNPFWGEDDWVRPIRKPEERSAVLAGPPCCIVASSGMLTGGPSAFYAAALAADEKNLIAITGYQDEESPGRRLLDLAEGASHEIGVGERRVAARCKVVKYNLSAHADSGETGGLVSRLKPKDLVLVHGEGESRRALAGKLAASVRKDVHLPALGDSLELSYRHARARTMVSPIAAAAPVRSSNEPARVTPAQEGSAEAGDDLSLSRAAGAPEGKALLAALARLLDRDRMTRTYSLQDLAQRTHGPRVTREQRESLRLLLGSPDSPVTPDAKRPFLFRRRSSVPAGSDPGAAPAGGSPGVTGASGRLEQNEAIAAARAALGPANGLTHVGASRETWQLVLSFDFPLVAQARHRATLDAIAERTRWTVAVHPETNQARLASKALELAPAGWPSGKTPAIHREERRVVVKTAPQVPFDPALAAAAAAEFLAQTGYALGFERDRDACLPQGEHRDAQGRLEINQAYARIKSVFEGLPHAPRKMGRKVDHEGPFIEVAFISPAVGQRYEETLRQVASAIGWRIGLFPRADQQAVIDVVRAAVPSGWTVVGGPGLDLGAGQARLLVATRPPDTEIAAAVARVRDEAGFELVVIVRGA